jgi:hypothetical protein
VERKRDNKDSIAEGERNGNPEGRGLWGRKLSIERGKKNEININWKCKKNNFIK